MDKFQVKLRQMEETVQLKLGVLLITIKATLEQKENPQEKMNK